MVAPVRLAACSSALKRSICASMLSLSVRPPPPPPVPVPGVGMVGAGFG
jgi:hypothetical protein